MPLISHISIKDIKESNRFDAEYFKPEYLYLENKIKKLPFNTIRNLSKEINYGLNIEPEYSLSGINFIRAQNLKEYGFDGEILNIPYSKKDFSAKELLKEGDLVIVRSGANVGDTGIATEEFKDSTFGSYVIKFDLKDRIDPFFVFIFLKTKFGKMQTLRFRSGAAQPNISIPNLNQIIIPTLNSVFQEKIKSIFFEAYEKQNQSKILYKEAEEIFLKEFGLLDHKSKHVLTFSTTKKDIDEAKRIDSEYYQPKYEEIIKKIEKYNGGFDEMGEIAKWKKGVEVGAGEYLDDFSLNLENAKSFIRVSDFTINGIEKGEKKIAEEVFEKYKKDFKAEIGDILFTKDGTIGITHVLKEEVEGILSGAFLRLTLSSKYKDMEKEFLALVLNSSVCKSQIEKLSGGALIAHLKPSDFQKIKIPLVEKEIQKEIADKVLESYKLRKESKELLEEAKRMVEEEIEKE